MPVILLLKVNVLFIKFEVILLNDFYSKAISNILSLINPNQ
ncbi:hypothetical protein RintRC_3580 [Richelia intracellularis]|nr:hypothetical protein RintRC_3580 [Richelia intracellularis]